MTFLLAGLPWLQSAGTPPYLLNFRGTVEERHHENKQIAGHESAVSDCFLSHAFVLFARLRCLRSRSLACLATLDLPPFEAAGVSAPLPKVVCGVEWVWRWPDMAKRCRVMLCMALLLIAFRGDRCRTRRRWSGPPSWRPTRRPVSHSMPTLQTVCPAATLELPARVALCRCSRSITASLRSSSHAMCFAL